MYGIINKSMEELVTANFGAAKWEAIVKRSGVGIDFFLSNEAYDDSITYQLAGAIAAEMELPLEKVLFLFGEWWILKTTSEKYGTMLQSGGNSLKEFLVNLPAFHNRIMLIYPKLTPPEFKTSDITENSIQVHYYSKREGLKDFVHGLLSGLAKLFSTDADITLLSSREEGHDHETFKVSW